MSKLSKIVRRKRRTKLMTAALFDDAADVARLIVAGADIRCCDGEGETPLHYCSRRSGFEEVVRLLLERGADVDFRDDCGKTPLLVAGRNRRRETVQLLMQAGADVHARDRIFESTLLHSAAKNGWVEIARELVERGVDLNVETFNDETAVELAALCGHRDVAWLLIRAGADVHAWLRRTHRREHRTLLHNAAGEGWTDVAEYAFKPELVDVRDPEGRTPLQLAVKRRHWEVARFLLRRGADWNARDTAGKSPLRLLVEQKDIEAIRQTVEIGAHFEEVGFRRCLGLPFFKDVVLRDVKMCTLAVMNEFNKKYLSRVYEVYAPGLVPFEQMKLAMDGSEVALGVERAVQTDITQRGHCDLLSLKRPLVLKFLAVASVVERIN